MDCGKSAFSWAIFSNSRILSEADPEKTGDFTNGRGV